MKKKGKGGKGEKGEERTVVDVAVLVMVVVAAVPLWSCCGRGVWWCQQQWISPRAQPDCKTNTVVKSHCVYSHTDRRASPKAQSNNHWCVVVVA